MKTTKYDYILSLCTGDDPMRKVLSTPFKQEGYYCATDSRILCVIPDKYIKAEYEQKGTPPSAVSLLNDCLKSYKREVTINRDKLLSYFSFSELKWRKSLKQCSHCEGHGEAPCECCGNYTECEECKGKGELETAEPFDKLRLDGDVIELNGFYFVPNLINKLLMITFVLGEEQIKMKYGEYHKPVIFEIKDCKVLILPVSKE